MMSRHFALSSKLTGAIAKRLPHAKNQLSTPGSFFNQFVTDIDIYICVLARREIRESGPTAFQIIILESSNSRTN